MVYNPGPAGGASPRGNISGFNVRQVPNYTAEQNQLFNSLLGKTSPGATQGLDYLSQLAGGNEQAFQQGEAPAYRGFQRGLDEISKRYAGVGALGSSGFRQAASGAAQSFGENLGARRQNLQQSAIDRLLSFSQNLLQQQPYDTFLQQKKPGAGDILKQILQKLIGSF